MKTEEVTLSLSDWTRQNNGKQTELPRISVKSTIIDVKADVLRVLAIDGKPDSILLFMGSLLLEDGKTLREYNKSNRSKLSISVYERVDLRLRIRTLQHVGSGAFVCVPLWSFLCRQTFHVTIADHETVGELKKRIADELDDPERYPPDKIKLSFGRKMLLDDKKALKDVGLKRDSSLTFFVACCYWKKSRDGDSEKPKNDEGGGEDTKRAVEVEVECVGSKDGGIEDHDSGSHDPNKDSIAKAGSEGDS